MTSAVQPRNDLRRLPIAAIGRTDHPDFLAAMNWLDRHVDVRRYAGVAELCQDAVRDGFSPRVVLLLQARPSEVGGDDVERVHRVFPLARLVGVLGSACEGEVRSGRPWPGVVRVYWHQFEARAAIEFGALADDDVGSWSLPRTATDLERFATMRDAFTRARRLASGAQLGGRPVLVRAVDRESFEALAEPCKRCGLEAVWLLPGQTRVVAGWLAGFWDEDGSTSVDDLTNRNSLKGFVDLISPAPAIVCVGFPRVECVRAYRDIGFAAVVSKPYSVDELLTVLSSIYESHATGKFEEVTR